ncbi:hypothetical protein L1049_015803 [Liquidambar formosana]|uniref:DNA repair protein REV1 n=1 Tax=Liquidambar formosana TaxID=63359 RepID=A0AAP0RY75_LIQFO
MSFDSSRSANSGNQSKRSLISTSSNPSNSSNNSNSNSNSSNKKKKTNQKTLGMAWGSNSRSSSRSSFRNSPFSDFGSYMVVKNQKLQNQFDAEASSSSHSNSSSGKPIFHGVSIFVDGFTVPSSQELRGYMLKHGGRFENYFSRHRVTHIICSNLPDSKIKNLRSFSSGLPVVKPIWVLDSVAANKLLSWVPYQIDQLANNSRNQPKLSAFFALKSNPVSEDATNRAICQVIPEIEDSTLKDGKSKNAVLSEVGESLEHTMQCSGESDDPVHENSNGAKVEEPAYNSGKSCELKMAGPSNVDTEYESGVKNELQSSPQRPSSSVNSYCSYNKNNKSSPSSAVVGPSNQRHSTLEDPNFVENYFKNSRLHFIGTWRNRYRKRFPSLSNRIKSTSSNFSASTISRKNLIIHVDMDCFFVAVVIRNHPELRDKPVAVCHSDNPKGTAEVSSANYPARDYGVKAGIFVRDAKALCPHLVIFPYNFKAYEEVADQFYSILHKHCSKVQAVSCDEAFLEVADSTEEDPELIASLIRKEIFETTGCTASAGIAGNMLMARLATRTAKPDGQCCIPPEKVDDYLHELPIKSLPGIGHVLEEKLKKRQVWTCGQLRMISKEALQKEFGIKTGDMLWNYSRGVDNRLVGVIQESKSIGAEVNWGVRFKDVKDSQDFLINLCKEVSLRLQGCGVQGCSFTLKIKKRRKDAEEPTKYMGCGDCENLSHSITVPVATDDVEVLQRITKQLFGVFHIDVKEIRGIGLQVSKLESADTAKQGNERNSLRSWLISAPASTEEQCNMNCQAKNRPEIDCDVGPSYQVINNSSNGEACLNEISELPPLCNLDIGVIESLPPELFSEINEMYGGKLIDFIAKRKGTSENISSSMCIPSYGRGGARNEGEGALLPHMVSFPVENESLNLEVKETPGRNTAIENLLLQSSEKENIKQYPVEEIQAMPIAGAGSSNMVIPASHLQKTDLMPSSLSQVDNSVLQQLPEELRVGILERLPAHRRADSGSEAALGPLTASPRESLGVSGTEDISGSKDFVSNNNLWSGNPPLWVDKFKVSNCLTLKNLAEMYYRSGATGHLSSILQRTISESQHPLDGSCDGLDEAICSLCELLKQYIKLKIESDIEEIYVCFCLLRRFTMKSKFFLQVYNIVFPYLQEVAICKIQLWSLCVIILLETCSVEMMEMINDMGSSPLQSRLHEKPVCLVLKGIAPYLVLTLAFLLCFGMLESEAFLTYSSLSE